MTTMPQKAVFFDRDGVLNIDTGYPHRLQDCHMIDGADAALKYVNDRGYVAFIVTNQGGIALGLYDDHALHQFNEALLVKIGRQGGEILDIAHCPHHPKSEDESLQDCSCRKPKPGMLLMLAEKHGIDLSQSVMVGDRDTDIEAAHAAGCKGYLFTGGNLFNFIQTVMDQHA